MKKQSAIRRQAFTLVELLVVIGTIALVLGIAMPGIIGLFTAGADVQARGVISAMLGAARGLAVEDQAYTAVHVQIGTDGKCWAAVMKYDSGSETFKPADGYTPRQIPGNMAFGEITSTYVSGGNYQGMNDAAGLRGFTTFNVVFSPDGAMAARDFTPTIETDVKIFGGDSATGKQQIWEHPVGLTLDESGIRAMTIFSYKMLQAVPTQSTWLNENGQFLCINPYTGQLLKAK